ncbi:MAG TPA: methyltransferase domain-containing protein [Pyrinomonadaceae bacterium]|nr:methyltransferase domain-containing protein [Pyrinomonadaceae bacterium]
MKEDLYARAGIEDVAEFYRTKFVSDEVLDARYFRALDRFDMHMARTMWVYDNVRAGASVLDVGCGAGLLAPLKRKGVSLAGVDLSAECARAARRNGYDATARAELTRLPFADSTFDYVVSLDVLGHINFDEKRDVLSEIRRVLRPGGVTLHGIECIDRRAQKGYDEMTPEELARFVRIDGHVGLEEEEEHAARFRELFAHVAWEPRYALCLASEEFVKQADEYGLPFERDFVEYLRGLSRSERRAFDMAMGYVFGKVSDLGLRLPKSGLYVFLKASDAPLGPFYNEHRDRRALLSPDASLQSALDAGAQVSLDRHALAHFDAGWHEPNDLPPVARWMSGRGRVRFDAPGLAALSLDLTTHLPDLAPARPLRLEFLLNGTPLTRLSLFRYGWLHLRLDVPPELSTASDATGFELEIRADRTWRPRPDARERDGRDDREMSVAVCNLVAHARVAASV